MYAKFVGTLTIMSFHASVWLHAARALFRSYGVASGHVGAVDKVCFQKYGLAKSSSNSIYFTVNNNKQARKTYLLFR